MAPFPFFPRATPAGLVRVHGFQRHQIGRFIGSADDAEDARKIYVAASRAKRLLVLAVPKNSAPKLEALLAVTGCAIQRHDIV